VPVGNVFVGNSGGDVKHDDATLAVDVVTVTKTAKFLLSSGIPDIKLDGTEVLRCLDQQMKNFVT
jgi:hypothetical protein